MAGTHAPPRRWDFRRIYLVVAQTIRPPGRRTYSFIAQRSHRKPLTGPSLLLEVAQNVANLDGLAKVLASGAKASVTEKNIFNHARWEF